MKFNLMFIVALAISNLAFSQPIKKTQIMVLGTAHLAQITGFESASLSQVLDSLNSKKFDVVGIEQMPSQLLLDIKGRPESYWQELYNNFSTYIEFGKAQQNVQNLTREKAQMIVQEKSQKENLTEDEKIELINANVCSYDIWSAVLVYQTLQNKNRLSNEVGELLGKLSKSNNEINQIGITVAKSNNLKQIFPIDNLQDETILLNEYPKFMEDYQEKAKEMGNMISNNRFLKKQNQLQEDAVKNKNLYPLYQFFNSDEYSKDDFEAQWAIWFKTQFPSKTDRARYSLWEMRNLLITANILKLAAAHPEKKILIIIGASHRGFIEKYLEQLPDVEVMKF